MHRPLFHGLAILGALGGAGMLAYAQRPGGGSLTKAADVEQLVTRMMAFDADADGVLARAEVTDDRLARLFGRADSDGDGSVRPADLTRLAEAEHVEVRGGPPGSGGPARPDGGGSPPGFGGPGPGRPGELLPPMMRERLQLSSDQERKLADLQKLVDDRLAVILSPEQRQQLDRPRDRRPGRPGPPSGR